MSPIAFHTPSRAATGCSRRRLLPLRLLPCLIAAFTLSLCWDAAASSSQPDRRPRYAIPSAKEAARLAALAPIPTRQVLVKLRNEVAPRDFASRHAARNARGELSAQSADITYMSSVPQLGWHVYRLPSASAMISTLAALRQQPEVLDAEPDQALRLLADPPTNPKWGKIAAEYNFAQLMVSQGYMQPAIQPFSAHDYDTSGWHYSWTLETVNALDAWNTYPWGALGRYPTAADRLLTLPSSLPLVAVLDTGVDFNHPGFASQGQSNTDFSQGGVLVKSLAHTFYNGVESSGVASATDVFGHGTSVSGVIAAAPNNGYGIPGLGFTSGIVPVRIYGSNGDGLDSDLIKAIVYAVDSGCLLVNISARTDLGYSSSLQDATDYAWKHGTLVVAASGNDGNDTRRYPASNARVLCVGASAYGGGPLTSPPEDQDYTGTVAEMELVASYSNLGQSLGVVAPAGDTIAFNDDASPDDDIWSYLLLEFAIELGIPSGSVPELPFTYTTAPTFTVPLSDATNTSFGEYAQLGMYGLNYGSIPGTSFACPLVVGLGALYAAKNRITQVTPLGPQTIVQAIEKGSEAIGGIDGANFDLTYGYGRINAANTLSDSLGRATTTGGIVGLVRDSLGHPSGSTVTVYALKRDPQSGDTQVGQAESTTPDGVYHLIGIPAGDTVIQSYAVSNGQIVTLEKTVTVVPGCDAYFDKNGDLTDLDFSQVSVKVAPEYVSIPYGGTQQFTANIAGLTTYRVTWTLSSGTGATIGSAGLLTAPIHPGSKTIARLQAAVLPSKPAPGNLIGTAGITFGPVTVAITPNPASVAYGKSIQLNANVGGTVDKSVTWSMVSGAGTINATGMYTAPAPPSGFLGIRKAVVKAVSVTDPTVSNTVTINLTAGHFTVPILPGPIGPPIGGIHGHDPGAPR